MVRVVLHLVIFATAAGALAMDERYSSSVSVNSGQQQPGASLSRTSDWICGPRSVQRILRYYGVNVDLVALVRETQWPRLDDGATLLNLKRAIEDRGIYTYAMKVGRNVRVRWKFPVLVHLRGEARIGHYAVWLPNASVVNVGGASRGTTGEVQNPGTGILLLTSPSPILHPKPSTRVSLSDVTYVVGAIAVALSLWYAQGVFRKSVDHVSV